MASEDLNFKGKGQLLTTVKNFPFKIILGQDLDKNFCFYQITKNDGHKHFQRFLEKTVYKSLTISQVEELYLRKKGPKEQIKINGNFYTLQHLGISNTPFRIFGYYDPKTNDFVLHKIDPTHKTHK